MKMINFQIQALCKLPLLLLGIFSLLFLLNLVTVLVSHTTGHNVIWGFTPQFSFDMENNIPTYFSSVNLLICAVLIFFIYRFYKIRNIPENRYWFFLSFLFLYLSLDESASFHEMLIRPMNEIFGFESVWLYYPWVIPGIIICLVIGVFLFKFYTRLPMRYRVLFGLSAFLFIGGSIGMEIIDGVFVAIDPEVTLTASLLITMEETLEMLGIITFIYALIDYMNKETVDQPLNDQSEVSPVSIRN